MWRNVAWVRLDDEFTEHPKMVGVGPLGIALQTAALCYCNHHLTDGYIPGSAAKRLLDLDGMPLTFQQLADKMLSCGIWVVDGDGYRIHDYLEFQPSREEVLAEREQKRSAGSKGGQASAQARASARGRAGASAPAQASPQAESKPVPVPDPETETDRSSLRSELVGDAAADPHPAEVDEPAAVTPDEVGEIWNATCGDELPQVRGVSGDRSKHVAARIAKKRERRSRDWWAEYFGRIRASPFLSGRKTDFRASFDWATGSEANMRKVLEGNYDDRGGAADGRGRLPGGAAENGDPFEFEQRLADAQQRQRERALPVG